MVPWYCCQGVLLRVKFFCTSKGRVSSNHSFCSCPHSGDCECRGNALFVPAHVCAVNHASLLMAGFAKVVFQGSVGVTDIINVCWYRADEWLPLSDESILEHLDALAVALRDSLGDDIRECLPNDYTLVNIHTTAYDDEFNVVDPGSYSLTVNEPGFAGALATDTRALTANIALACGQQTQVTGVGKSKRNRGHFALGPVASEFVSDDGVIENAGFIASLGGLADGLKQSYMSLFELVSFIPIRIHRARTLGIYTGITRSDVIGATVPVKVGFRRSRMSGG